MPTQANARDELRVISRAARQKVLTVAVAAKTWGVPTKTAATRLASLADRGWIARIRRGLYYILPVESGADAVAEDPWVLADVLFSPCYVGGWSAAEHWGLTEQVFRSTFVFTSANIRHREQVALGTTFHLARVPKARVEDVSTLWRDGVRVRVASPERMLVDAFVDPARPRRGADRVADRIPSTTRPRTSPAAVRSRPGPGPSRGQRESKHANAAGRSGLWKCARRKAVSHIPTSPCYYYRPSPLF